MVMQRPCRDNADALPSATSTVTRSPTAPALADPTIGGLQAMICAGKPRAYGEVASFGLARDGLSRKSPKSSTESSRCRDRGR